MCIHMHIHIYICMDIHVYTNGDMTLLPVDAAFLLSDLYMRNKLKSIPGPLTINTNFYHSTIFNDNIL